MEYIGNRLQKRMNLLGMDVSTLSCISFTDERLITDILENRLAYDDIDRFDFLLLCSALHCEPEYFADSSSADFLETVINHEKDTDISIAVKAKIQDFLNSYAFVSGILASAMPRPSRNAKCMLIASEKNQEGKDGKDSTN